MNANEEVSDDATTITLIPYTLKWRSSRNIDDMALTIRLQTPTPRWRHARVLSIGTIRYQKYKAAVLCCSTQVHASTSLELRQRENCQTLQLDLET